jgi:molybdopterin converting factor small subunit
MAGTTTVTVRLWASARAAAGVDRVEVPVAGPVTVSDLAAAVVKQTHGGDPPDPARLERVLSVCSVLVGEQPLGSADPTTAVVEPGATVEFLPPFAGG